MNYLSFHFTEQNLSSTAVSTEDLYTPQKGYGFVIEENRNAQELLQIPELNSGFEPWYFLNSEKLSCLKSSSSGIYAQKAKPDLMGNWPIPLHFKADVPSEGNYTVRIKIKNTGTQSDSVYIFTGRRRLMSYFKEFPASAEINQTYTINISDIIPRGKTVPYADHTFDLTIISNAPITLSEVEILPAYDLPTLYIAGDSTVTDQFTSYPYHPGCSYCGWAQMLPDFLTTGLCVSNHSHSGLTTQTFRSEGHYSIIQKALKPNDYVMFQFGHNDQKLPELDAYGGYTKELLTYIHEIREKGAHPILITPLARNTWLGNGKYNDLLADYADACLKIGVQENVPVIDLHGLSQRFIIATGLERSKAYFFPNDYTHTNDYGGFKMAGFVASEISGLDLTISNYVSSCLDETIASFCPPKERIAVPEAPAGFVDKNVPSFSVAFTDIESCKEKELIKALAAKGIISNRETLFRPKDLITRVEALEWIIKAVGFVPMNVYNDYYPDVIGHEWYAGIVEVAYQNDLVDPCLTAEGYFHPNASVTAEELLSFVIRSYKCRKHLPMQFAQTDIDHIHSFALESVQAAHTLQLIHKDFIPEEKLTREKTIPYIHKLTQLLA